MNIRWRLSILAVQLSILLGATSWVTDSPVSAETWFLAGLFAVVVNPQLLEPWYAKPQDVLANALVGLFLIWTAPKGPAGPGWMLFGVFVVGAGISGLLALALGASRTEGGSASVGRASSAMSRVASSSVIYSTVFWLALIDYQPAFGRSFWTWSGMGVDHAGRAHQLAGRVGHDDGCAVALRTRRNDWSVNTARLRCRCPGTGNYGSVS